MPSYEAVERLLEPAIRRLYRLEVRGEEHVPREGGIVIAANHLSIIDPFVLGTAIPRRIRFLAKEELWSNATLGRWMDDLGGIRVARGRGDREAIAAAVEALDAGEAVGVFPEGRVRSTGPWLRGAARMALVAGAPILPVRLIGTDRALAPHSVGFPPLVVLIGELIVVERASPTIAGARALTGRLEAAVRSLGA